MRSFCGRTGYEIVVAMLPVFSDSFSLPDMLISDPSLAPSQSKRAN
jgi:hypothetical protein